MAEHRTGTFNLPKYARQEKNELVARLEREGEKVVSERLETADVGHMGFETTGYTYVVVTE